MAKRYNVVHDGSDLKYTDETGEQTVSAGGGGAPLPLLELAVAKRGQTNIDMRGIGIKDDYVYIANGSNGQTTAISRYKIQAGQWILNNYNTGYSLPFGASWATTAVTIASIAVIDTSDDYIYYTGITASTITRMDVTTQTEVAMTLSGVPAFNAYSFIASDGTNLFIFESATTTVYKCTLSGTTITYVSTITLPNLIATGGSTRYSGPTVAGGNFYYFGDHLSGAGIIKCSDTGVFDSLIVTGACEPDEFGYGKYKSLFVWNGYVTFSYVLEDSEDQTHVGLQIIDDLN